MNRPAPRLIIVYNADTGWLNALKEMVLKIVAPASYPCSLCALTYGWVSMRRKWRCFLGRLPYTKVFHHRDDFTVAFPELNVALPAILLVEGRPRPQVLVSANELDALDNLDALIALVEKRLILARQELSLVSA